MSLPLPQTKEKMKATLLCIMLVLSAFAARAQVVVDSVLGMPLPSASVFDCHGRLAGICSVNGEMPFVSPDDYPLTIRYMGFCEKTVSQPGARIIRMRENVMELPEFVVETGERRMLHMLAYIREYSTLCTYSDTVFLFREKMVDYMLPAGASSGKLRGWRSPRVLSSRSYYRFTNTWGLDSVSDRFNQHFSWADWVGISPEAELPAALAAAEVATDTVRGRYSPAELWHRSADRVTLDVDVLADTASRKWVPNLSAFFRRNLDFEQFRMRLRYGNVVDTQLSPVDLAGYSFNIESRGRGRSMFLYHRPQDPFFVSTYGEVYMLDKEYITVKDARRWESLQRGAAGVDIYEPADAPPLQPNIVELIARVESIDHDALRLGFAPDERLGGRRVQLNFGQKVLSRVKQMFGIDEINARRKWKRQWRRFRDTQREEIVRSRSDD